VSTGVRDEAATPHLIVAGNANVDLLVGPLTPWPQPGTEVLVERTAWRVGGALGNTALALSALGVEAQLVYDVGDDMLGDWLARELAAAGPPARRLTAPTSLTVALNHPDGERTFVSHLGHLAVSDTAALRQALAAARPGDLLLIGGSFLLPRWRPELASLLERARAAGVVTALDTGWPTEGWTPAVRAEMRAALAHVDLFLPNLVEVRGLLDDDHVDAAAALTALAEVVPGRTLLKLGADGAATLVGARLLQVRAPSVGVIDTVGAGDTFNAVVLAALRDGFGLVDGGAERALRLAVELTSRALSSPARALPTWASLSVDVS